MYIALKRVAGWSDLFGMFGRTSKGNIVGAELRWMISTKHLDCADAHLLLIVASGQGRGQ